MNLALLALIAAQAAPLSLASLKLETIRARVGDEPVEAFVVREDGAEPRTRWELLAAEAFPNAGRSVPELAATGMSAAVNANFYREDRPGAFEPIGLTVHESRIASLPNKFYPTAGVIDGRLEWDFVTADLSFKARQADGTVLGPFPICRLNAAASPGCASLWLNPPSGLAAALRLEASGLGPRLGSEAHAVKADGAWSLQPQKGLAARAFVEVELTVRLKGERLHESWQRVTEAVSGSHVLTATSARPAITRAWALSKQPRTLTGVDARGRVWIAVFDGRRETSRGSSVKDAFQLLHRRIGAEWALNLDGGGSTTLMLDGRLVNKPSDGFPRAVAAGWGARAAASKRK